MLKTRSLPVMVAAVLLSVLVLFVLTASRTEAKDTANSSDQKLQVEDAGSKTSASGPSTKKGAASDEERVVPDGAAYKKGKAEANAEARAKQPSGGGENTSPLVAPAAQTLLNFSGVSGSTNRSDSNGAKGTDRYIEITNAGFALYDSSGNATGTGGTLRDLTGQAGHIFDPMIIWDPDTNRFYYSTADTESSTDKRIDFGFSTTSTPQSAADFCKYTIPLGSVHADFPRLGDTMHNLLIGTNNSNSGYLGSFLYSISKPAAGSSCPDKSTFTVGQSQALKDGSGGNTETFDPVPANQVDSSGTGWVVARAGSLPASALTIYKVAEDPTTGTLDLNKVTATDLSVPTYKLPANAPQPGTKTLLDTLDAGPTQAVSAIDPSRSGAVALWVQHTVFGGAGAEVHWYEIDPTTPTVFQSGKQTDSSSSGRFFFNAAISPDRMNSGQARQFGDSMVLTYNSSSKNQYADIRMVSKEGSNPVSPETPIKASSVAYTKASSCSSSLCHWGDYPGASPDPAASSTGSHGQVWLTNMWAKSSSGWGTQNWAATP